MTNPLTTYEPGDTSAHRARSRERAKLAKAFLGDRTTFAPTTIVYPAGHTKFFRSYAEALKALRDYLARTNSFDLMGFEKRSSTITATMLEAGALVILNAIPGLPNAKNLARDVYRAMALPLGTIRAAVAAIKDGMDDAQVVRAIFATARPGVPITNQMEQAGVNAIDPDATDEDMAAAVLKAMDKTQ